MPGPGGVDPPPAGRPPGGAQGAPPEGVAVRQGQDRPPRHRSDLSPPWTIRPPTTVYVQRPTSRFPFQGVLRLLEWSRAGSTTHSAAGSRTATSATAPGARVPAARPQARAGPTESGSTTRRSGRATLRTSLRQTEKAGPSPPHGPPLRVLAHDEQQRVELDRRARLDFLQHRRPERAQLARDRVAVFGGLRDRAADRRAAAVPSRPGRQSPPVRDTIIRSCRWLRDAKRSRHAARHSDAVRRRRRELEDHFRCVLPNCPTSS